MSYTITRSFKENAIDQCFYFLPIKISPRLYFNKLFRIYFKQVNQSTFADQRQMKFHWNVDAIMKVLFVFFLFFLRKRWWALNWFFCLLIFFVIFDHLFIFFYLLCGRCCCYCSWGMWSFLFHMCELVRTELILVSDASLLMAEFRLLKRWKQQLDGTSRS